MQVERLDTWAASLKDEPGGLAEKLKALREAGANLEFVIARRTPEKPDAGVLFVIPIKGAGQVRAAKQAGFAKSDSLHSVRLEGPDKPGEGARITQALAEAGLNLRGFSAAALGRKFVAYIAVDSPADATKAMRVLQKL